MVRFTIFGIPVIIQPFFWITLALLGAMTNGGGDSSVAIFLIALFMLAGFLSILVHELGHALVAKHFGAHCHIVLESFGGYAAYQGVAMNRLQSFLITAAGPALQALFGLAVLLLLRQMPEIQPTARYFLKILIGISWFWALFNILPILPLDGGRMLDAILGPQRVAITLSVTIITAILVGILLFIIFKSIIAPIFLGMFAWQAWKQLQQMRWP